MIYFDTIVTRDLTHAHVSCVLCLWFSQTTTEPSDLERSRNDRAEFLQLVDGATVLAEASELNENVRYRSLFFTFCASRCFIEPRISYPVRLFVYTQYSDKDEEPQISRSDGFDVYDEVHREVDIASRQPSVEGENEESVRTRSVYELFSCTIIIFDTRRVGTLHGFTNTRTRKVYAFSANDVPTMCLTVELLSMRRTVPPRRDAPREIL